MKKPSRCATEAAMGSGACHMEQQKQNKQTVISFYDLMFNQCKPADAIERYAGDVYIQHNPTVADGKQAFIESSSVWRGSTLANVSSSDELSLNKNMWSCTATRSGQAMLTGLASTSSAWTTREKIVEHWDVLQRIPAESANGNSMF
jgi:predicted SnoaL-like aldol condensation-catalyzing enzyme